MEGLNTHDRRGYDDRRHMENIQEKGQMAWDRSRRRDLDDDDHSFVAERPEGCWSSLVGCVGGMWSTRQTTNKEDREGYIKTTLRELTVYLCFLLVACIITLGMTNKQQYHVTNAMVELFVETPYWDTRNNLRGSTQVADFWRFTQTVFLDSLFVENWYDTQKTPTSKEDRNILYENRLLGVPRIRQIRMRNDSCGIPYAFHRAIKVCYSSYDAVHEDKRPFGLKTIPTYTYQSEEETGSGKSWGKLGTYSGAGSFTDLKRDKLQSKEIINELHKNLWIDRATRVVFMDFTTYNANLNLFCVAKVIFEFPPTGGIIPSWTFRTVKLLRYITPMDYFILACEIIFVFFIFYYIVEEILEILQLGKTYFKSIWNILDLVVILLSLLCIAYNIYNYLTIEPRLEKLLEYPDKYANFEEMGYWQVQFNCIVAICVFFCWFKLFKYISFNKTMTQLSSTLSRCAQDVAGFAIMFFIVFSSFAQLGYLLFGTQVYDFHTFIDSCFTLLRTILGDFNFREIEQANRILGPIFFLCYVFFVFFVLLNMFLAIINDTYAEVKAEIAQHKNEFEVADFFKRGYGNLLGKMGKRDKLIDIEDTLKTVQDDGGMISFGHVRKALKKCNFSELEIEMFFAKYDLDGDKKLGHDEIRMMLQDLDNQKTDLEDRYRAREQRPATSRSMRARSDSTPLVISNFNTDEFQHASVRVEHMEYSVTSISSRIDHVLAKMENVEKSRAKKKEAMGRFLDDLLEEEY